MNLKGTLYLCATPIGNLEDITLRVLNTLKSVDLIACEDTRHTLKLLTHFNISKPLTSYFEHNKTAKGEYLIGELLSGKNIALATDAGTPAISDPGEDLVKRCIEHGIKVVPLPGAVALINALIISGMDTGRFAFEGFLPINKKQRSSHLNRIKDDNRTLIFYEAPHKLTRTLDDLFEHFGDRKIAVVKELTKIHETALYFFISEAVKYYELNPPKGEFVLIVEGAKDNDSIQKEVLSIPVREHVLSLIDAGMTKKDAIKESSRLRGVSKRDVYNEYIKNDEE